MIIWFFAKDPIRQNFTEIAAQEYIEKLDTVTDFRKLGTQDMYVIHGGIMTKNDLKKSKVKPQSKSIDFSWKTKGLYNLRIS